MFCTNYLNQKQRLLPMCDHLLNCTQQICIVLLIIINSPKAVPFSNLLRLIIVPHALHELYMFRLSDVISS